MFKCGLNVMRLVFRANNLLSFLLRLPSIVWLGVVLAFTFHPFLSCASEMTVVFHWFLFLLMQTNSSSNNVNILFRFWFGISNGTTIIIEGFWHAFNFFHHCVVMVAVSLNCFNGKWKCDVSHVDNMKTTQIIICYRNLWPAEWLAAKQCATEQNFYP